MNDVAARVVLQPLSPAATAAALVVALAAVALAARGLRRLPPRRRAALVALRALGALGALTLLFQPMLRRERRAVRPSRVLVLVDDSASMSLPAAGAGGERRIERARALARDALRLGDAGAGRAVELFALGRDEDAPVAVPTAALDAVRAVGPRTALGEALAALPRSVDRDLAAVVVLSDGADQGRVGAAERADALDDATRAALRAVDAPIHTIAIGEARVRDLAVGRVARDDFAFVRTPITFDVPIEAHGAAAAGWVGRAVPVTLRRDGAIVAVEQLTLAEGPQRVMLRHLPERVGEFVFDVSVPALPGEVTTLNNVTRFSLRVVRDRVRVLQVCGRPSWDERFLRNLLKRDPNIDLISFFILRTPSAIEVATRDELSLIEFPTDELFRESLHTFDLVILQNFEYGPYQMTPYLPLIRRYVEEGGALAMLGGELSFAGGGYAGTPIEAVLPVELDPVRGAASFDPRPFSPRLTAAGRAHPLTALALDVDESAKIFAALPPLDGVNRVRRARPGATVLVEHPALVDADRSPLPIIAVRDVGRGRVLSVGSDSTWRWSFQGPATGARAPYERFWESAIRWLVRDPSLSLLRIELDRATLAARGVLSARATAVGPDYRPVSGARIAFVLDRVPEPAGVGTPPAPPPAAPHEGTTDERGVLERTMADLPEGAYRLRARATLGGREVEDEVVLLVPGASAELADPAAHPATLAAISAATGGEARAASAGVAGLAMRPPREARVAAEEDRPLWASPWVLLGTVAALVAAWGLGRRWGRR